MNQLKELIESKFSNINKFCNSIDTKVLSKQTVYKLLKNPKPNPTLTTAAALAHYLQMDLLDLINVILKIQKEGLTNETY